MWRKAQDSGVASAYMRENEVKLRQQFHSIIGLPFVPVNDIPRALDILREDAEERLDPVLDLVEDYYVLGRRRGRFVLLRHLMQEDRYAEHKRQSLEGGVSPPKKKKRYEALDRRLQRLVERGYDLSDEDSEDDAGTNEARLLRYMSACGSAARSKLT